MIDYIEKLNGSDEMAELRVAPQFRKQQFDALFKPMPIEEGPSFNPDVFALIPNERSLARLRKISYFPGGDLDIAAIGLEIGIGSAPRFPMQAQIMSNGPDVGDRVVLCGFPVGNAASFNKKAGTIEFKYKIKTLEGHVTERFGWGEDYFVRSPGFRIDVGAPSGFSGGAVLYQHPEFGPAVCGIVSASDEQRTTAAIIYPALGLENVIPHSAEVPDSLLGLCSLPGALPDIHDAPSYVKIDKSKAHTSLRDYVMWSD
ncbi:MAG: hypothetical protein SFV20_10525 [Sphingopyxis sp.]|nr:hypothetical protein [Sphingopyxis sp.]